MEGGVAVKLVQGAATARPGDVAVGTWTVHAMFRDAYVPTIEIVVKEGEAVTVKCSDRMRRCVKS